MSTSLGDMSPQPDPLLLALHAASTLYMAALLWRIQRVDYPGFAAPDHRADRLEFHARHIPWIAGPAMILELVSGFLLYGAGVAIWTDHGGGWLRFRDLLAIDLCLLALIWVSTGLVQAPAFGRLREEFDVATHRRLVATNWIRTGLWTARAGLVLALAWLALHPRIR